MAITETLRNPLSMFDVKGKVAVITGASGAFGRACALSLGALGGKLVLASGNLEELDAVCAEVIEVGGEAVAVNRRPDSLEDAEAIRDAGVEAFGSIEQLVIASGTNKAGFIHEMDYEDWQDVMDANVRGAWVMAKPVGRYWIENEIKGKMLLMSSVRGRHWMYSDDELGQATRARSLGRIPLGRLAEVEDLMGMALYLLSPASDFCTGQVMYLDGGFTAG